MYRYILDRIGRRGAALIIIGTMWVMRGLMLPDDPGRNLTDEAVLYEIYISLPVRQALWIVSGILSILAARCAKTQWIGWFLVCMMPLERAIGHAWSGIMWVWPGVPNGSPYAFIYMFYWLGWTLLINLLASWGEDSITQVARPIQSRKE